MEIITAIISFASAVVVAYIGYLSNKRERRDKERDAENQKYIELQKQLEEEREKNYKKEETERNEEIKKIHDQLEMLTKNVDEMRDELNANAEAVTKLSKVSSVTLEYTSEMNEALLILASYLTADTPDKTQLSTQVQKHQHKTNEIANKLYQFNF